MMLLAVFTILAAQGANAELDPDVHRRWKSYAACIETRMIELEPSKADVDDIFEAAKTQCAGSWGDATLALMADFEKRGPAPSGKSAQEMAIELLDGVATSARDRVRVTILRQRAGLPPIDASRL